MTQAELLRYVARALEESEIPYMIGGSQAAVYYGEPRFTRDVDVVAGLESAHLAALLGRFPAPEFYVSEEAAREAVETRGKFNVIHPASGLRIDIFVNRDTPYDRLRLERRRRLPLVPGLDAWFARAEDVILSATSSSTRLSTGRGPSTSAAWPWRTETSRGGIRWRPGGPSARS